MKIYRYILTTIVALGAVFPAMAQKGMMIGVTTGVNSIVLLDKVRYGDVDYTGKFTLGHTYGLTGGFNFTDQIGLHVEINKADAGMEIDVDKTDGTIHKNVSLNYMQVPILFHYSGGNYKNRFTADIGPQFSYLGSAYIYTSGDEIQSSQINARKMFRGNDLGMVMDAGGDITLKGNLYMNMKLRFYYGFTQVNKDSEIIIEQPDSPDVLNNASIGMFAGLHYLIR